MVHISPTGGSHSLCARLVLWREQKRETEQFLESLNQKRENRAVELHELHTQSNRLLVSELKSGFVTAMKSVKTNETQRRRGRRGSVQELLLEGKLVQERDFILNLGEGDLLNDEVRPLPCHVPCAMCLAPRGAAPRGAVPCITVPCRASRRLLHSLE